MIRIGTSGYNHRDWIGSFYPADLGPARYLVRYAEEFDLCELNVAVHRLPLHPQPGRELHPQSGVVQHAGRLLKGEHLTAIQRPPPAIGATILVRQQDMRMQLWIARP